MLLPGMNCCSDVQMAAVSGVSSSCHFEYVMLILDSHVTYTAVTVFEQHPQRHAVAANACAG
jgi:hypothetical protein